jgi:stalled ribosome alternative rescue factor ArfA
MKFSKSILDYKNKMELINATLPDGKFWRAPANKTHKDKTTYNRKNKHKNKEQW